MMLLQIPGTLIHTGKPTPVINDQAHLPVIRKTSQNSIRSAAQSLGGYLELCLIHEFNK